MSTLLSSFSFHSEHKPVLLYFSCHCHANQTKPGCCYIFEMFGWITTVKHEETSKYIYIQMCFLHSPWCMLCFFSLDLVNIMMSYPLIECRRKLMRKIRNTKKASIYWRRTWCSKNDGNWRNQSIIKSAKADISNCVNYSLKFAVCGFLNIIVPKRTKCDENQFMKHFGVALF